MGPLKRSLVFAAEASVLLLRLIFYVAIAILFSLAFGPPPNGIATLVFWLCFLLTVAAILWFRRKTRSWKIQYDAAGYLRKKMEGESHFLRARVKKEVFRTILRVPSAPAAVVVFFFPFATHLASPNSQNVRGYCVPIPWKDTILFLPGRPPGVDFVEALTTSSGSGRFGVTPFWSQEAELSRMRFLSGAKVASNQYDNAKA
jgi:hypothetical protein